MWIPDENLTLARQILNWAKDNYDEGGHWIVETMTLEEIKQEFKTLQQAKEHCRVIQDRQEDIQNS
jgi:hypothetical protein